MMLIVSGCSFRIPWRPQQPETPPVAEQPKPVTSVESERDDIQEPENAIATESSFVKIDDDPDAAISSPSIPPAETTDA